MVNNQPDHNCQKKNRPDHRPLPSPHMSASSFRRCSRTSAWCSTTTAFVSAFLQSYAYCYIFPTLADVTALSSPPSVALLAWLISYQPTVLFSQNKPATSNQPAVLFSQNKSAPTISHQPNEQAGCYYRS
jgi:hypothetical protein